MGQAAPGWDCHVRVFDEAAPVGVGHLVLVQPSVYGADNRVRMQALSVEPGRHRGVAVLADDTSDGEAHPSALDDALR